MSSLLWDYITRGWGSKSPRHKCTPVPHAVKGGTALYSFPWRVKGLSLLSPWGSLPCWCPQHYGLCCLNTFPLIKINETYTNLFMPVSNLSMNENFLTKCTFVFLFIHVKFVNLEKNQLLIWSVYWYFIGCYYATKN